MARTIVALLTIFGVGLWWLNTFNTVVFNYSLAVTVEYRGKQYVGEGVWQFHASANRVPMGQPGISSESRGEAIPIEVGDLGRLYFLKRSANNSSTISFGRFLMRCDTPGTSRTQEEFIGQLKAFTGPCRVDLNDVQPLIARLLPSAPFMETVSTATKTGVPCQEPCVVSVVLARTDHDITTGLTDQFNWLAAAKGWEDVIVQPTDPKATSRDVFLRQDFSTEYP